MALTALISDSVVESVKQAVKSSSTCTHSTVSSLQGLLSASPKVTFDDDGHQQRRTVKHARATAASTRLKSSKTIQSSNSAKAAVFEVAMEIRDGACLSQQEKLVLATEVFNAASKTLSDALQGTHLPGPLSLPASPNRTQLPTKTKSPKNTSSMTAGPKVGVLAVAECAILALSCLRVLRKSDIKGRGNEYPNIQLEQGSCILAGKLVALGQGGLAYKELQGLKRRIQQYLGSRGGHQKNSQEKAVTRIGKYGEIAKESIADLTHFTHLEHAKLLLGLLVLFQANAMKLIASHRKISVVERIHSSLALSNPSSPAEIIMDALETGALSKDKAALQLLVLSNNIYALCPITERSMSSVRLPTKSQVKPITSIMLQLLSLEIRSMSWKVSEHTCKPSKELWDPLARYLSAFIHQCDEIKNSEFAMIYDTVLRLQGTVMKKEDSQLSGLSSPESWKVAFYLGKIAQEAGCINEALSIFSELVHSDLLDQQLMLGTIHCRIVSLHFHNLQLFIDYPQAALAQSLAETSATLTSPLKGSNSDLEDLLIEASKLKKLAIAYLDDPLSAGCMKCHIENETRANIIEYLHGFIKFLRRYIGRQPTDNSDAEKRERFRHLLCKYKNVILAAIDSVVAVGRMSVVSQMPPWEKMLPPFADCTHLLTALNSVTDMNPESPLPENWRTAMVKLSNIFWSRHLKEKETGRGYVELIPLLEQATSLLQNCRPIEKVAGFAALKYERLAHLYAEANMGTRSEQAFRQSIQEHIDSGVLQEAACNVAGKPPHRVCQEPKSPGFVLGRVLLAYLKTVLRRKGDNDKPILFEDKSLDIDKQGILLEWQMGLLVESRSHDPDNESFRSALSLLLSNLLTIYTEETHPIHRMRVIFYALRFILQNPNTLDHSFVESLVCEATAALAFETDLLEDTALKGAAAHIKNSLRVILLFHKGDFQSDEMNTIIESWLSLVHQCRSWESLESHVGDIQNWISQIRAIADYVEAYGIWKLQIPASELLLHVMELQTPRNFSSIVLMLSKLASHYCRLGNPRICDFLLSRASRHITEQDISCYAVVYYNLASVENMIESGSLKDATNTLATVRTIYEGNLDKKDGSYDSGQKLAWERIVANAALLHSRLATALGSVTEALFFGRLSVRLSSRLWAKLEKLSQKRDRMQVPKEQSELDLLTEGVALIDLSNTDTNNSSQVHLAGSVFWSHVASHHAALLNLMRLSAHNGFFQDTIYYGEHALKLNMPFNTSIRLLACRAQLGLEWIRAGHLSEAREILDTAMRTAPNSESNVELAALQISLATLNGTEGRYDDELCNLCTAESILADVTKADMLDSWNQASTNVRTIINKPARLKTRKAKDKDRMETIPTTRRRAHTRSRNDESVDTLSTPYSDGAKSMTVQKLRCNILCRKISNSLSRNDINRVDHLLNCAQGFNSTVEQISLQIEGIKHMLADVTRRFTAHAIYCVIPESTLSIPSIQPPKIASARIPPNSSSSTLNPLSASRKQKAPTKEAHSRTQTKDADIANILSKARASVSDIIRNTAISGSTIESHASSYLIGPVSLLSHAVTLGISDDESLVSARGNEIGRICAFEREQLAVKIDKQLAGYSESLNWPAPIMSTPETSINLLSEFSRHYIDILPPNWNVISISLNDDHTEFMISKLRLGSDPFLLRLPLKRSSVEEAGMIEEFNFDEGKQEMKTIIQLANASAHDARSRTNRNSKREWWATRELLDQRLKALLCSIENVWLGGFRGMFCPTPQNPDRLSCFARSFEKILNKFLPSRGKSGKSGERLKLDHNVLELFTGLRDLDEKIDPEDALMDLLYFVVDILQFKGERNAYDEIDFDMMTIETLDILRSYDNVTLDAPDSHRPNHTILILDKALHLFPWESLPCLQGLPVSRMPSLNCLRDKILQCQTDPLGVSQIGHYIDRNNGAYILNPGGDLKITQIAFEGDLSNMKTWSGVVNQEPREEDFKAALETKSLLLYFGHGSGAQYIRGRTIKRLNQCAVTFLMGCSSGCLSETGEFEPYGMPMNYMHAGSPALVATLWDVTDKDIDRFARSVFEEWGLVDGSTADDLEDDPPKSSILQRGEGDRNLKSSMSDMKQSRRAALDEAVAQARDSCVLRYLNGAAPVIYGVPVYLNT